MSTQKLERIRAAFAGIENAWSWQIRAILAEPDAPVDATEADRAMAVRVQTLVLGGQPWFGQIEALFAEHRQAHGTRDIEDEPLVIRLYEWLGAWQSWASALVRQPALTRYGDQQLRDELSAKVQAHAGAGLRGALERVVAAHDAAWNRNSDDGVSFRRAQRAFEDALDAARGALSQPAAPVDAAEADRALLQRLIREVGCVADCNKALALFAEHRQAHAGAMREAQPWNPAELERQLTESVLAHAADSERLLLQLARSAEQDARVAELRALIAVAREALEAK